MAEKRKVRKRKEPTEPVPEEPEKATKEEYAIARWMRKNIEVKKTKFLSHTVEYFTASKAVDKLMDSPWAQNKSTSEEPLFTSRESVVYYLDRMLRHKLFHRARKIIVPESELKSKKKKGDKEKEKLEKEKKDENGEEETKKKEDITAAESSQAEVEKCEKDGKIKKKKKEEEKKKRKIRLDMHLEQRFVDGLDAYVWLYEPTPYYYYFFGFLVVIAVIAVCLFPLWPSSVRQGVYYLSLAAAGFLVFILALAVLRLIIFCVVWGLTLGRHHLWLLPNLTEDVGFFQSFWPLYKYEYKYEEDEKKDKKKSDKKEESLINEEDNVGDHKVDESSESESEGSQKSQTGKDFEMVDKEDIDS